MRPYSANGCVRMSADFRATHVQLAVRVRVDGEWGRPPSDKFAPTVEPQTHLARVRSSDTYASKVGDHVAHGKLLWTSAAVLANVSYH
mmetsp:Transcript_8806/g.19059  ORF Transcript_8806/g.19059 Transcript_8806/m.19059 type:complete len:88 (-) Transcript_8806:111-374(-)